ncbi:MAG: HAD family hydrolase, partial [Nitrospiraceae bacterium]
MTSNGKKLLLFDIDGTLISAGGAGTRSMNLAFESLFGIRDAFSGISMAGKTDPEIMKEGLKRHGFPFLDGNLTKMREQYLRFLAAEINNPLRCLKPGVREALDALGRREAPLGLLTGNLEEGAEIKLSAVGIYRRFIDGAFGSDDEDRDNLLPIAVA